MTSVNIFQTFNVLLKISKVFGLASFSIEKNNYLLKLQIVDIVILIFHLVLFFILGVLSWTEFYLFLNLQPRYFSPIEIFRLSQYIIDTISPFVSICSVFRNRKNIFRVLKTLNEVCGEFDNLGIKYDFCSIKQIYLLFIFFRFATTVIVYFIMLSKFTRDLLTPVILTMFQSLNAGIVECQFMIFVYVLYDFLKILNKNYDKTNVKASMNVHFILFSLQNELNRIYDIIIWNILTILSVLSYINYRVIMVLYEDFYFLNVFRYIVWGLCHLIGLVFVVTNCQLVQEQVSENCIASIKLFYTFLLILVTMPSVVREDNTFLLKKSY